MKKRSEEKAPKSCRECANWASVKDKVRVMEALAKAIKSIEERMSNDELKPTVGDYLKLVQLEKELGQEEAREIRVTWVGPESET